MTALKTLLFFLLWTTFTSGNVRRVEETCRGTHCFASGITDPKPCSGTYCSGRLHRPAPQFTNNQGRSAHVAPSYHNGDLNGRSRVHSEPFTIVNPQRAASDLIKESGRTRPTEVFTSGCVGADCATLQKQTVNDTRECKGIECKLPLRVRPSSRTRSCVGGSCPTDSDRAGGQSSPVHIPDRAAQILGEFSDFGYTGSDTGGPALGIQLICDIKPDERSKLLSPSALAGENEVPSEDALVLQLQLAKGQEELVAALQSQQATIRELQQRLSEQQGALMGQQREILQQQREILQQQREMLEQAALLRAQSEAVIEVGRQGSPGVLQGDVQGYLESHLQERSHLHKSYAVHKVDLDAKVMDVGAPLLRDCGSCGPEEYCDFQRDPPQCERCTTCPPGFFLVSQCSQNTDRICQDRDECLEIPDLCGERVKCLNTPGGFRCLGISERDAVAGVCGHQYFYNRELQECQACSDCEGEAVVVPCSAASDTVCGDVPSESRLSRAWSAAVTLPPPTGSSVHIYPGLQLSIRGKEDNGLLSNADGTLEFRQHGLVWADHNFALRHSCRNFLQIAMRLNNSEEGVDLSGVRVEQPDGKYFQSVSVSGTAEVEPEHVLSLLLKSPNHHCNQSKDLQVYELTSPFSLLWLSHDTGAVAMTAQMSMSVQYQTNYRPAFKVLSVSDPYMVTLTHDSRGVRFTESGVVKFVFQQAVYSMGHTCVREGFSLVAYLNTNGTNLELMQAFKSGVNYRDTSISLSGSSGVNGGDSLSFEILSPAQCNVRYFGDSSGISSLSLLWVPSTISASLSATITKTGLPSGAVRNKPLHFRQETPSVQQVELAASGQQANRNFVFREKGVASVSLNLKLIHSCNVVKLTLNQQGSVGSPTTQLAQQVGGQMPEGSEWTSVGLRTSFEVTNGTLVFVTLDCVRGRVNQVAHEGATKLSILWVAA